MKFDATRRKEIKHAEAVRRKIERRDVLESLLATHEQLNYDDRDTEYIRKLKYRIRSVKQNLTAMKEIDPI